MKKKETLLKSACPCGSSADYLDCCGRWHLGGVAPTPEALMRSRYSAYALGLVDYLLDTWHPSTRPEPLEIDASVKWIGLQILSTSLQDESHGRVGFLAHCRIGGRAERMHEDSRFVREEGRWYYLDGEFVQR